MLWTLLTATSSLAFLASAVFAGVRGRIAGYVLATIIGLMLAAANAWGMYKVGSIVEKGSRAQSDRARAWCFSVLYGAAALWIPCAVFLGESVTGALMPLFL